MSADGVWLAFYWDGSAVVPFADELTARRYAGEHYMEVRFARYGDSAWQKVDATCSRPRSTA